nr:MAG TPA: hypothetical protein [Caudoviricetes sp.]
MPLMIPGRGIDRPGLFKKENETIDGKSSKGKRKAR